jgi:hypothetical protein
MVELTSASLDPLWRLLELPIGWISDGTIEPEVERPLEYLELLFFGLVLGLSVLVAWDASSNRLRERQRRAAQEAWRRQLKEHQRRLRLASEQGHGERLGPGQ